MVCGLWLWFAVCGGAGVWSGTNSQVCVAPGGWCLLVFLVCWSAVELFQIRVVVAGGLCEWCCGLVSDNAKLRGFRNQCAPLFRVYFVCVEVCLSLV